MPLVLAVVGGYSWYRLSDTGKRWRYEDKLASYCGGVLPYEETVALTGLPADPDKQLPHDMEKGTPRLGYDFCWIGHSDVFVTAARVPSGSQTYDLKFHVPRESAKARPTPLGGGWRGFTDGVNTTVVLPCTNRASAVVVTANRSARHAEPSGQRQVTELVTATATKAAERWGCESKRGTRVPEVTPATGHTSLAEAKGTCAGLSPARKRFDEVAESTAEGLAPFEVCELVDSAEEYGYSLTASYGPYAQRMRGQESRDVAMRVKPAGKEEGLSDSFWASAQCPGDGSRALFRIQPYGMTGYGPAFARAALAAFAERSADRHGCTDLRLPAGPQGWPQP
ncbi:hypothetical protein [Streptomyces sp. NPDC029674]|uniref:hypothetical protein n=1 Tax=Streptomyces sp. NPDC029674 TaxID=3365297 RepID=UPI00384A8E6A